MEAPDSEAQLVDDRRLAQLVRDLADAVIICDASGDIVFWNEVATAVFGWAADDVMGKSLDVIIPERLQGRHWKGYHEVMATGHTEYGDRLLEVPARHKDGHSISIAFTVSLLAGPESTKPLGIAAVIRDDTKRFQERRELKAQLAKLSSGDTSV
jgi:PAS domain S-box-containing protein